MREYPRLPDSEFAIMQIIWSEPTPITTNRISELVAPERGWKPQTVYTLLIRLVEKGFLKSEKQGKERCYTPTIMREDYLNQETGHFMKIFHKNSVTGLMNALFSGDLSENDLTELEEWLDERR